MAGVEEIKYAFPLVAKAADAFVGSQRVKTVSSSRDELVRIRLVAHIPHQAISWEIKNPVERQRDLDRAQVGRKMAAVDIDDLHDPLAKLVSKLLELLEGEAFHIFRVVDTRENVRHWRLLLTHEKFPEGRAR